jgi:RNA polymerase sigma-70 factor (ECF subfamily)
MADESSHSDMMLLPVAEQRPIDANWFEETYHAHAALVLAFVKSRVRSLSVAEDIAQQVWLKVWSQASTRFDGRNARGWILQIAKNQIIDNFRAKRPLPSSDKVETAVAATDVRDDELRERTDALRDCLNGISTELSTVIRARLLGKAYDEIATELEIPLGTAHSRFSKAKDQLRRCVEGRLA